MAPRPHILTKRLGAKHLSDKRIAVSVVALVIASLVTTVALAGPVKPATWNARYVTQYPPLGNHSQFDAVIAQPGQAWFFGGSNVTGTTGVPKVLYRSHGRWLPAPLPSAPTRLTSYIIAASATSATNMWVVTRFGGAVLFWDGLQWTEAPKGNWSIGGQFTGITVTGPSDVWLFGSASGGYLGAGTWHLTPAGWKQVFGAAAYLNKASATGPGDIWAIGGARGSMRTLAHYNGTAWARVQPRALEGFRYSYVFTLAADNVWVAGSIAGQPDLGHFNGHRWTTRPVPGTHPATGMCRDGSGGMWVIANTGTSPSVVRHLSKSGHWSVARVSKSAAEQVLACALVPGRKAAWGAGRASGPQGKGTAAAAYGTGDVP